MKKNNYLFYSEYIKGKDLSGKELLVAKTKTSYLIGPLINKEFNNNSFYKRIISNGIYSLNIYKKMSSFKCIKMINKYEKDLSNNEVIEVLKMGDIIRHNIIRVPGEDDEK